MKLQITVRGSRKTWCFEFDGDPEYLKEWWADGLAIDKVLNIIPQWVVNMGLIDAWCAVQDFFYRKM